MAAVKVRVTVWHKAVWFKFPGVPGVGLISLE